MRTSGWQFALVGLAIVLAIMMTVGTLWPGVTSDLRIARGFGAAAWWMLAAKRWAATRGSKSTSD